MRPTAVRPVYLVIVTRRAPASAALPAPLLDVDDVYPELLAYQAALAAVRKGPRARRRGHDWIDERTRAIHAAIAAHVRRDPMLLDRARDNLDRFGPTASPGTGWTFTAWRQLLDTLPLDELLTFLESDSEWAANLRQSSPFFGILPSDERQALFLYFESL